MSFQKKRLKIGNRIETGVLDVSEDTHEITRRGTEEVGCEEGPFIRVK